MIDLSELLDDIKGTELEDWSAQLPQLIEEVLAQYTHGDLDEWLKVIDSLPTVEAQQIELQVQVRLTTAALDEDIKQGIIDKLKLFHPWRKGPFHVHGIDINTEWRSDWKWDRIAPHLSPLKGRTILDVGCGNGYHLFRMLGEGAKLAIGIDPSQKFLAQFLSLKHFTGSLPAHLLPLGIEHMPRLKAFDTVFSMGVLYHRRSPIDHIQQLKTLVRKGGELIIETLVVDGDENTVLVPKGRYAQMRNVWFLPSIKALARWLARCDLHQIRMVDCNQTSIEEQRATEWMHFHSLENYLDPNDHNKTIEGYPAPKRATFIAKVVD